MRNVTVDANFIGDIRGRGIEFMNMAIDKESCVGYCSYDGPTKCYDIIFTNNIAAGCVYAGFVAPGYDCGNTASRTFYNNVAHSVDGYGGYMYPDEVSGTSAKCMEFSHFTAYKNSLPCVVTHAKTLHLKAHDLNCIDNE